MNDKYTKDVVEDLNKKKVVAYYLHIDEKKAVYYMHYIVDTLDIVLNKKRSILDKPEIEIGNSDCYKLMVVV